MAHRVLPAHDADWRPSNQMAVSNNDIGKQLEATTLGARLWRLEPGQASTRHRHKDQTELYVLLEGRGRLRADEQLHKLEPLSAVVVDPDTVRQVFNDTDSHQLWLIVGAPPEGLSSDALTPEQIAHYYPDGPKALPPELASTS